MLSDADKARKHGLDEFVVADPCKFDHHSLLVELQSLTLEYRLNDPHSVVVSHVSSVVTSSLYLSASWVNFAKM